jgi:putative colanic acid biosynthesis UDP-glucose lipid carrier transferase
MRFNGVATQQTLSMTEPVILKNSFAIACVALLRVIVPPFVAVACLYVVVLGFNLTFDRNMQLLAGLAGLLTVLLSVRKRNINSPIFSGSVPLALGVAYRWGLVLAILLAVGYATKVTEEYSRRAVTTWAVVTLPLLIAVAAILERIMWRLLCDPSNARKTVFVGLNEISQTLANQLTSRQEFCMSVVGFFDDRSIDRLNAAGDARWLGKLQDLAAYVKANGVHVIFISLPMRHLQRVRDLLDELRDTTASIYYLPDIFVFDLIQSRTGEIAGIPVVALCETPFYGFRGVIKRLTDIVISMLLMLFGLPVLLFIGLMVGLTSRGPIIFKQRRYGLDGHQFVVYKFRTMTVTEDGTAVAQATRDDRRITAVGRFLRRHSLDELPQLINVLQGRMSLVGPRPHAVAHNEEYRKVISGYMIRHKVLPGITGLAQINGCRGETAQLEEMRARVQYDLEYLRHWSPILDLKILALTAFQVVRHEKAY